jgi:hypothetical protein
MSPRFARLLTRFYSSEWRARYGEEFARFLEESPASVKVCFDVAKTGLHESLVQWLRRRARTFRGIVSPQPRRMTSATLALGAVATFIMIVQATPLLAMHRGGENVVTCVSDSRIKYEPGAAQIAAIVSKLLPRAIEETRCEAFLNSSFSIYIVSDDKTLKRSVRHQEQDRRSGREWVYLSPKNGDDPEHILETLERDLRQLKSENHRER